MIEDYLSDINEMITDYNEKKIEEQDLKDKIFDLLDRVNSQKSYTYEKVKDFLDKRIKERQQSLDNLDVQILQEEANLLREIYRSKIAELNVIRNFINEIK